MNKIIFKKINPYRDWKITIVIFGLGLVLLSAFAWKIYLSDHVGGGYLGTDDATSQPAVKTIDKQKLQTTINSLKKIKSTEIRLVDPSL